jgi:hypothetical protein
MAGEARAEAHTAPSKKVEAIFIPGFLVRAPSARLSPRFYMNATHHRVNGIQARVASG